MSVTNLRTYRTRTGRSQADLFVDWARTATRLVEARAATQPLTAAIERFLKVGVASASAAEDPAFLPVATLAITPHGDGPDSDDALVVHLPKSVLDQLVATLNQATASHEASGLPKRDGGAR